MMAADDQVLAGKLAVVTGSAQGIGLAIARRLQQSGAELALIDFQEDELALAVAELSGNGPVGGYVADLSDPGRVTGVADEVVADSGRIDVLVNNAGRRGIHPFAEYPLDDWNATLALNLTAPFLLAQRALASMIENGGGRIVNITSVAADLAFTKRAAYNASKAGLVMLTKSIAVEYASVGIRCNAVAPGIIETSLNSSYLRNGEEGVKIREGTPTGGWGQPADIAGAVRFLSGPESGFINGEVIRVDGGWTAGKGY